jgi:dTDP-4-dehydrorhamnose reductase
VKDLARGRFWIVRTQWIFGFRGKNFVDTILAAARSGKPLRVVDDQVGCPTYATDFARALLTIVEKDPGFGTFHGSSQGSCSWFEFTEAILAAEAVTPVSLDRMKSTELDRPAKRPLRSVLRNFLLEQTIGDPLPHWKSALDSYLGDKRRAPN